MSTGRSHRGKETDYSHLSSDIKNDLLLAFNIFKNEKNTISKIKLRTILFSFAMYKSSARDINEFISEQCAPRQEEFTFEDVCRLISYKLKNAKEKEAEELFQFINPKGENTLTVKEIERAFEANQLDANFKEITEMFAFMSGVKDHDEDVTITKEDFKKFYTEI